MAEPILELERVLQIQNYTPRKVEKSTEKFERAAEQHHGAFERMEKGLRRSDLAERLAKLRSLRARMENAKCEIAWAQARRPDLDPVPAAAEAEYLAAKADFEALDHGCDALQPEGQGWVKADAKAAEWIACRKCVQGERNEKLRVMKNKRAWHESVLEMLAKHERLAKR